MGSETRKRIERFRQNKGIDNRVAQVNQKLLKTMHVSGKSRSIALTPNSQAVGVSKMLQTGGGFSSGKSGTGVTKHSNQ